VVRQKLTLRKQPPADPVKIAQSLQMGLRFVDRSGRYILQQRVVTYGERLMRSGDSFVTLCERTVIDSTWVDIPLVPETYGEAQA
jgi:hypothetical protein